MNNVSLTGRLTREPELRYGGQDNSTAITRFTLAVDDGKDTDFINIKCLRKVWLSFSRGIIQGRGKAACITTDTGSVRGWQQWQPYYCVA